MSVVAIVGGSSGIGRAAAVQFAARGYTVAVLGRSQQSLQQTLDLLEPASRSSHALYVVDVRDGAEVARVVDEIEARQGAIDVFVESASVMGYGRVEELPIDVFRAVLETNVLGVVNTAQAILPKLRGRRRGTFIVVGSLLGQITVPTMGAYSASKWALAGLVRTMVQENLDMPDVHICLVSPGAVDTPIYGAAANVTGHPGKPPPPVDTPERVAQAIVDCTVEPRDRISVGAMNGVIKLGFALTPRLYDRLVGPASKYVVLSQRRQLRPTTGNVLEPKPRRASRSGGWTRFGRWRPQDRTSVDWRPDIQN